MMKRKWMLALLCAALLYVGPLRAQVGAGSPADEAKRERVQALIMMRLSSSLRLNAAQSQKLGGILRKYHQEKIGLRNQMRDLTMQLQAAYNSNDESEINRVVAQITAIRGQIDQIDDETFADLQPMLSPKQQAQYFLIMDEIHREVQSIRRGNGPGGPAMPEPGAPNRNDLGPTRVAPPYY